jgi:hypothetical protein
MTTTDRDVAALCSAIYARPDVSPVVWDHFDAGADDGVCWGLKRIGAVAVIVHRGSVVLEDWLRDLDAVSVDTSIGTVHAGFFAGMQKMWSEVKELLVDGEAAVVAGHSLGAARADDLAGLMVRDGRPPIARVVFGEPKPGFLDLARLIEKVPGRSYRNGDQKHHDLVTDVPFSFPPLQYVHPTPIIPVTARPPANSFASLGVFAWHHIDLYVQATPSTVIVA